MEMAHLKQNRGYIRIKGIFHSLVFLVIGIALGAFLYSRFLGNDQSRRLSDVTVSKTSAAPEIPSDIVQISPESQREAGIAVEPVDFQRLQKTLSATGIVSEDPSRIAHIRPLARGPVDKIYVRLGDRVSAGDPLLEYDNIELGVAIGDFLSAQAELRRSLTDLEVKEKILERSRVMLKAGALAQTTFDLREAECKDAEAKSAGAQATVAKIREQIRRFGLTEQDLAKVLSKNGHTISHSILRAPFSGVVTSYHAAEGEIVEPAAELLAITDMSSVWVLADIYEKDLSHIRTGKDVRVQVASYPGEIFEGKITYIADVIDQKSRTAKVRCLVRNRDQLLKLEMFATIEMPVDQASQTLAVPTSSIQQIDGQPVVFVRKSDSMFQQRKVQTGAESRGFTEIRSGLKPGEAVVTRGSFTLKGSFLRHLISEKQE